MPLTPYHWGPASWLGLLLFRYLDFSTLLIASVIIDIEPFLVIIFNLDYPLHGFLHTFLGGSIVAFLLALLIYRIKPYLNKFMSFFQFSQDTNFKTILITSLIGVYSHVLLDAPLYTDIKPFYPIKINPLYGFVSQSTMYSFCRISFIPALLLYIYVVRRHNINTATLPAG